MRKLKHAQSILEYVIILAVVCAALVAIGAFVRPASNFLSPPSSLGVPK